MKKTKLIFVLVLALCVCLSCVALTGCGAKEKGTDGLVYERMENVDAYRVKSIGTATATEIVVPKTYKGSRL